MSERTREKAPLPCPEMAPIRARIDELDKKIVTLLAERQKCVESAGRVKPSRDTVVDQARIEEVIALVTAEAQRTGLSTTIAEKVWRTLIELSIQHEYEVFDRRP